MDIDLKNRKVVITGVSEGIGRSLALAFGEAGAKVAVNYLDDAEGVSRERAAECVAEWGEDGFAMAANVCSRQEISTFFDAVKSKFGGIDFLVNNAAVLRDRSFKKMSDAEWDAGIETNLSSVFRVSQTALPFLRDGGRIVNMASISGVMGFYGQVNYASAKAGVITLTKVLSRELAARQITVNAVAPGVVLTEMGESIPEAARQQMLSQIPLQRFGEPEEIASVILYLCSNLSTYVTGQTLHVNGGWWA